MSRNRIFIILIVTVLLLVLMGVSSTFKSTAGQAGNIVSVPLTPVQSFFSFISGRFDDFVSFFKDTKEIKQDYEKLKEKFKKLEKENRELEQLREENAELRNALKLKQRFSSYEFVGSNVIAKDPGNWFHVFKIDAGSRDGVKENLPVIDSSEGLIGKVLEPHYDNSKILSIIDENSVVFGWIAKQNGGDVRIKGDLTLSNRGLCMMDSIPLEVDVMVGDIIETSGLSEIFPRGLVIGTVIEVINTDNEFKRYAIVKPAANFKKLEEVFILKKKEDAISEDSVGE